MMARQCHLYQALHEATMHGMHKLQEDQSKHPEEDDSFNFDDWERIDQALETRPFFN